MQKQKLGSLIVASFILVAFAVPLFGHTRLGIVIDLSHTAEQTVLDVMEVSTQPVTTTHSGVRSLMHSPTLPNWSDEMIRKLASMRGVICVPFLPMVVNQEYQDKWHAGV
jgi:membrane dipeptidase